MDWAVAAGDIFLVVAVAGLTLAPVAGAAGAWRHVGRPAIVCATTVFLVTLALLIVSWRQIPGGIVAAASAHAALLVAVAAMTQLGRIIRLASHDPLLAGLAGLLFSVALTIGPFVLGPLMSNVPLSAFTWMLFANPLVTVSTAAGIDLLHLDLIYRLSPLAHRGVALPAWTTACSGYAVLGLAAYGASHPRLRSA